MGLLADSLGVKVKDPRSNPLLDSLRRKPKGSTRKPYDPSSGSIRAIPTKDDSFAPFAQWGARQVERGATALGLPEKTAAKAASYLYDPMGGMDAYDFTLSTPAVLGSYAAHHTLDKAGGPSGLDAGIEVAANMLPLAIPGAKTVISKGLKRAARFALKEDGEKLAVKAIGSKAQRVPAIANAPTIENMRVHLKDPANNQPFRVANRYTQEAHGRGYNLNAVAPETSFQKQSGIARAFDVAASDDPAYKHAVYEAYGNQRPDIVEAARAQNHDQLLEAAYRSLGGEVDDQFARMPVQTTFGGPEYGQPSAMLRDLYGNGNLNVFRGGDKHDFLGAIDPETGLSLNEKFRAAHDYYGHGIGGTTFRPGGEEAAYASHHQMLSPLSQIALLGETRGQNSFVNYSPLNAGLIEQMNLVRQQLADRTDAEAILAGKLRGGTPWEVETAQQALRDAIDPREGRRQLRELGEGWQYAPQKSVILPPEYLAPETEGGVPDWLQSPIVPRHPRDGVRGVHFGRVGGLGELDPSYFGTGHRGQEAAWKGRFGSPDRTYFYTGEPGSISPEQGLRFTGPQEHELFPYGAQLDGLYPLADDPENLVGLARAHTVRDKPAKREGNLISHLERLIKDGGYSGYLGNNGRPVAARFKKTKVDPLAVKPYYRGYARGGRVE